MLDLIKTANECYAKELEEERKNEAARAAEEANRVTGLCEEHFVPYISDMIDLIENIVRNEPKWFTEGIRIEIRVDNYADKTSFDANRTDTISEGSNQINLHLRCDKDIWLTLNENDKSLIDRIVGLKIADILGKQWDDDHGRIDILP